MLSFHSRTRMVTQAMAARPFGQRRHLVIMRGEQRAALVGFVQMLRRRPGDGEAVKVAVPRPISSRMTRLLPSPD